MSESSSLFKRLLGAWRDIADSVTSSGRVSPDLSSQGDADRLREQMAACLEARGGEVSARARAAALGRTYLELDSEGRQRFLRIVAEGFGPDADAVDAAMDAVQVADPDARAVAQEKLRRALEPPRLRLLTQFNGLPEGVKFLVDLRSDLTELSDGPELKALNNDLRNLLASWFDVGFLELRRITWNSPAALLEKLIAYEAVHEIRSWDDLKNRLEADRRLFAFFHPRMPDEPLIFVQVALVSGLAGNVNALLDESAPVTDPAEADTAIFYSITNAQRGLAGISFGGFLIKRVVDELQAEFKKLKTFSTLSPIPGFAHWIKRSRGEEGTLLNDEDRAVVADMLQVENGEDGLQRLFVDTNWTRDETMQTALEPILTRLCARYLLNEKNARGRARDPVAHFHLTNGAQVERLNWLADASAQGLKQSAGMMVNYLYNLSKIEENHERYTGDGKVSASTAVNRFLKK
ncbi:MAG: malonyl-CoA decarboxylase [Alphaproteobacteria bacterium]|nr:malonyl-CoA decarboxylase [Alphaproteobacteria bacterium]